MTTPEIATNDRVTDYTRVIRDRVRLRVRTVRETDGINVSLVADAQPGVWVVNALGEALLCNGVAAFLTEEPETAWCFVTPDGLWARVSEPTAICLVKLLEEVLSNPQWTAVLAMDPPTVPFDPQDGAPIRADLSPLEAD